MRYFKQHLKVVNLPLLRDDKDYAFLFENDSYAKHLTVECEIIPEEEAQTPYADSKKLKAAASLLCQRIVGLIYLRSLGNAEVTNIAASKLLKFVSDIDATVRRGKYRYELAEAFAKAKTALMCIRHMGSKFELKNMDSYRDNTYYLFMLVYELVGCPILRYTGNVVTIGNYAIVEDYNGITKLNVYASACSFNLDTYIPNTDWKDEMILNTRKEIPQIYDLLKCAESQPYACLYSSPSYDSHLKQDCIISTKHITLSPYNKDVVVQNMFHMICSRIACFIYIRSFGNMARIQDVAKDIFGYAKRTIDALNSSVYANESKLVMSLRSLQVMMQDYTKGARAQDLDCGDFYKERTKELMLVMWTLLGECRPRYFEDFVLLGDYPIVEDRSALSFLHSNQYTAFSVELPDLGSEAAHIRLRFDK